MSFPFHCLQHTRFTNKLKMRLLRNITGHCVTNSNKTVTSCTRGDTICLRPPPCKLTLSSHLLTRWRCCSGITTYSYLFARWHRFRHVGYLRHQQQVDIWPFDPESGVRVTCDMGYLCANFSLPRPLFWVTPNERNGVWSKRRQTKTATPKRRQIAMTKTATN